MPSKTRETPTENACFSADARNVVSLSRKYEEIVIFGVDGNEYLINASKIRSCVMEHLCSIIASKN